MSFCYFILFRQDGEVRMGRVSLPVGSGYPTRIEHEGRTYSPRGSDLSTGDHLLGSESELIGFGFLLGGDSRTATSRLVRDSRNVTIDSEVWLKFVLSQQPVIRADCCQLIFPQVYEDDSNDQILLFEECRGCWSRIAFPVAEIAPKCIFAV